MVVLDTSGNGKYFYFYLGFTHVNAYGVVVLDTTATGSTPTSTFVFRPLPHSRSTEQINALRRSVFTRVAVCNAYLVGIAAVHSTAMGCTAAALIQLASMLVSRTQHQYEYEQKREPSHLSRAGDGGSPEGSSSSPSPPFSS